MGIDNGNEFDDNSFKLTSRKAFNGRAYAVIQSGRKPGDIVITVKADGLNMVSAKIKTQQALPAMIAFEDLK